MKRIATRRSLLKAALGGSLALLGIGKAPAAANQLPITIVHSNNFRRQIPTHEETSWGDGIQIFDLKPGPMIWLDDGILVSEDGKWLEL